jgi:major membrane immunogen (membrane-anchored lipoprotein)
MKIQKYLIASIIAILMFTLACSRSEIDDEKPEIDLTLPGTFPLNCDTLYFGEDFHFSMGFTDNAELGSYSIEIHHNFDHHTHSTEITECEFSPKKTAVNPFKYLQDYAIPEGKREYRASHSIRLPSSNSAGLFDEGDYHLYVRLTDREGWSTFKGLSINIIRRNKQ